MKLIAENPAPEPVDEAERLERLGDDLLAAGQVEDATDLWTLAEAARMRSPE